MSRSMVDSSLKQRDGKQPPGRLSVPPQQLLQDPPSWNGTAFQMLSLSGFRTFALLCMVLMLLFVVWGGGGELVSWGGERQNSKKT